MSRAGNLRMRTGLQTSVRFGGREGKEDTHARENVAKSLNGFVTIPEGSKHDLSVEVVTQENWMERASNVRVPMSSPISGGV